MTSETSGAHRCVLDAGQALGFISRKIKGLLYLKKGKPTLFFSMGWPHHFCYLQVKISSEKRWWLECRLGLKVALPSRDH